MKTIVKDLLPPLLLRWIKSARKSLARKSAAVGHTSAQDLGLYWDPKMAAALEVWGEGNAWNEIQLLMTNASGTALDVACGTGKVMAILEGIKTLEVHGCDISDFLLAKATERGLLKERLTCCDATALPYPAKSFDYAYSIGSLEHFTEEGIHGVLQQCRRTVKTRSFHMIPVSRSQKDEGWITPWQSYFNNSTDWWVAKCKTTFCKVTVLDSAWQDDISLGKWLVCED
ncbi:MAG TPA: class I SAM-dependent methyltransferase [Steroidobacteraceae bacterium]|jgi:SAM-dependent methyltransferase|nr:class I SAM-dependent methyltransferase [Steroidobacteraceae bacterium]